MGRGGDELMAPEILVSCSATRFYVSFISQKNHLVLNRFQDYGRVKSIKVVVKV